MKLSFRSLDECFIINIKSIIKSVLSLLLFVLYDVLSYLGSGILLSGVPCQVDRSH